MNVRSSTEEVKNVQAFAGHLSTKWQQVAYLTRMTNGPHTSYGSENRYD